MQDFLLLSFQITFFLGFLLRVQEKDGNHVQKWFQIGEESQTKRWKLIFSFSIALYLKIIRISIQIFCTFCKSLYRLCLKCNPSKWLSKGILWKGVGHDFMLWVKMITSLQWLTTSKWSVWSNIEKWFLSFHHDFPTIKYAKILSL